MQNFPKDIIIVSNKNFIVHNVFHNTMLHISINSIIRRGLLRWTLVDIQPLAILTRLAATEKLSIVVGLSHFPLFRRHPSDVGTGSNAQRSFIESCNCESQ